MGQQQLLLIVLGVIIVGIAIVVGINLFNANAEESAKDTLVSEGTNLGCILLSSIIRNQEALGGGGNSWDGSLGINPPRQLLYYYLATYFMLALVSSCFSSTDNLL
jgi:hypothetical protein